MGVMADDSFLDLALLGGVRREPPLALPWPVPGNPGGFIEFSTPAEWRAFVASLGLIVAAKFRRAQMLYFAWLYNDVIKAGELMALATLELAPNDRYGAKVKRRGACGSFAALLACMIQDCLTDDKIRMIKRCGGSAIGFISGDVKPSLAEIRNKQAHGDPFDGFPIGGLLELIRNLIEFAHCDLMRGAVQIP